MSPRGRAPGARGSRGAPGSRGRPGRPQDSERPLREHEVGLLEARGRTLQAVPFFGPGRRVTVERRRDARPGDLVLVRQAHATRGHARIERVIGSPDVARDVLEALMLDRGLRRRFGPGIQQAAVEQRDRSRGGQLDRVGDGAPREDLRELATFTIDPVTARDFDDAISAEDLGGGRFRVWVHIADVAAHVRPGTPLDRDAYQRATSVYVPGLVEPMLPPELSNDACSLKPHVDRLAVTVELELDGADVVRTRFTRSVIRSDERLDYDRVDRIFAGEEPPAEPWGAPLDAARAAARALGEDRARRSGSLAIEGSEPEFAFDREGHVTEAARSVQTESHRLIEHLMIAANEAVATLLDERSIPALYRIHERPDPSSAVRLLEQLESLGVPTPPAPDAETMTALQAAEIIGQASVLVDAHVRRTGHGRAALTSLVLRALKQARYTPHNLGHAGLGSERYCHFTSPIRRYPDLVCHRALLSAVGGGESAPRPGSLEEAGDWCSARERDAMTIERAADDIARCFLLEQRLMASGDRRQAFTGEVVGLIGAGAFVAFGDGPEGEALRYEGLLPVRRLRGDWWELNEAGTILQGEESGRTIRLGDPVEVVVGRIDRPRGRVDLYPADS